MRGMVRSGWKSSPPDTHLYHGAPGFIGSAMDLSCCDCILKTNKIEKQLDYQPVVSVV